MSQTNQVVADRAELGPEILAAFQGNIQPVKEPWTYRFGIFLVTIVMIALPLIYVGLIVLTAYVVYYHAVNHVGMLEAGSGRGMIFVFLAYLAPMVIGGILVLFMIKPLFARPARRPARRSLTREGEPLLFAFVERVCQAVGAPNPKRIDVDCEINASASFRRGLLSFLGSDLVLTIGMPLVAGLRLRQFAGVLAHEFGHFSQGAGMRLTYIIRTISHWFTRVVYERDSWDDWLKRAAGGIDLRIGWVLYLAMLFVWITRKILWVLMMIGHAVSGYMLRQMEFDADRHEARLAGSDVFGETCRQLTVLGVAYQGAQADLGDFYREGRLGDNLPRLILANVEQLPEEVQAKIDEHINNSRTGALDTHPADKDRIVSAQRENAAGIFQIDQPASVLFSDFDALSRLVTWDFYREIFGDKLQRSEIHPIDDLLARQNRQLDAQKALDRYFQGSFRALRPVQMPSFQVQAPAEPKQTAEQIKEFRKEMLAAKSQYDQAYAKYDAADDRVVEATQVIGLSKANFRLKQADFNVPVATTAQTIQARGAAVAEQEEMATWLAEFESLAGRRIHSALQLLELPQMSKRIEDVETMRMECRQVLPTLYVLNRVHPRLLELRNQTASLAMLCNNLEGNSENEKLIEQIRFHMEHVRNLTGQIHQFLANSPYPFDHAHGQISLAQYVLSEVPGPEDLGAIYEAGDEVLDKCMTLYVRLIGTLAHAAEKVETAIGLPRLQMPSTDREAQQEKGSTEE